MPRRGDRQSEDATPADEGTAPDRPEDTSADLESQAQDYLADNDVWMYGPNAGAVVAILDRLESMEPRAAAPLADAWLAASKADREEVRKFTRKVIELGSDVERNMQMAREAVATWLAVAAGYPEFIKAAADWPRMSSQVAEAAMDALTSLIMDEDLDESQQETLSAPWD